MNGIISSLALSLLLLTTAVSAQDAIYQWTDANGIVHFSDQPLPGSTQKQLQLKLSPPIKMATITLPSKSVENKKAPSYQLSIIQPTPEATIRNNQGNLLIAAEIEPLPTNDYQLRLLLDGKEALVLKNTTSIELKNIERGSHSLQFELLGENSSILAQSTPITIYLHRAGLNKPFAKPTPRPKPIISPR